MKARARRLVFRLGQDLLFEKRGETLQVGLGLFPDDAGLFESGLGFPEIEFREQLALLDGLPGHGEHALNAPAGLGFNNGAQPGAHGADGVFGGDAILAGNSGHRHRGRGEGRGGRRRGFVPATLQEEGDGEARPA
ncbi:MAG TPA: hypothetical protein PLH97_10335 [Verrucomicrobiota bacterium]|nr:hypothetical protein [Verrucomicrobiota bacterium]